MQGGRILKWLVASSVGKWVSVNVGHRALGSLTLIIILDDSVLGGRLSTL